MKQNYFIVGFKSNHSEIQARVEWINLDLIDSVEELQDAIEVFSNSPLEQWLFMEQDLGGIHIGESEDIETVVNIAQGLKNYNLAFVAFYKCFTSTDLIEFEERYQGEYESLSDYAEKFLEGAGTIVSIPDNLRYYFDYEKYAEDLRRNREISIECIDGKYHIFSNL